MRRDHRDDHGKPAGHTDAGGTTGPPVLSAGLLQKVRALLAKAEATPFEAEADAFTAKAQELMARYRIDRAVLEATGAEPREHPVGHRITIDVPYAEAKALLLAGIADANGCRAVWSKAHGLTTVFGFPDELAAVEELFTSLLLQATGALRREGSKYDLAGRSRTKRFRRSFLVAFAVRVGHRLYETVEATVEAAAAETGTALVPILTRRLEATRLAAEAAFPRTQPFATSVSDGEGWHAGTRFADVVDLDARRRLKRRPA
jgi:hypothetical protein